MHIHRKLFVLWVAVAATDVIALIAYLAVTAYASAVGGPVLPSRVHSVVMLLITSVLWVCIIVALGWWLDARAQRRAAIDASVLERTMPLPVVRPAPVGRVVVVSTVEEHDDPSRYISEELRGYMGGLRDRPEDPSGEVMR